MFHCAMALFDCWLQSKPWLLLLSGHMSAESELWANADGRWTCVSSGTTTRSHICVVVSSVCFLVRCVGCIACALVVLNVCLYWFVLFSMG